MKHTALIIASLVLLVSVTYVVAQEKHYPKIEIETLSTGALVVKEEGSTWNLVPQHTREKLDLRLFGTNWNNLRDNANFPMYATLATHILLVTDRKFANEIYRKENCEAKAAQRMRGMFVLTADDASFKALNQTDKSSNFLPTGSSRTCGIIEGKRYSVTHFSSNGQSMDSQFTTMKMSSPMPGMDPLVIFVADKVEEVPCEG